jgi:hypothetical protein
VNHRGRFQAQGQTLEESENWAQDLPLSAQKGHLLLNNLENKISKKEAEIRKNGFEKCREFINESAKNGGISIVDMGKPLIKSFPKGYKERVDVEVHLGLAFVKEIES